MRNKRSWLLQGLSDESSRQACLIIYGCKGDEASVVLLSVFLLCITAIMQHTSFSHHMLTFESRAAALTSQHCRPLQLPHIPEVIAPGTFTCFSVVTMASVFSWCGLEPLGGLQDKLQGLRIASGVSMFLSFIGCKIVRGLAQLRVPPLVWALQE